MDLSLICKFRKKHQPDEPSYERNGSCERVIRCKYCFVVIQRLSTSHTHWYERFENNHSCNRVRECSRCHLVEPFEISHDLTCTCCQGSGEMVETYNPGTMMECPNCDGSGRTDTCQRCGHTVLATHLSQSWDKKWVTHDPL